MSRRRRLSEEEYALWVGLVRSITPLRRPAVAQPSAAGSEGAPVRARTTPRHQTAPPVQPPPLAPFERRLKQRVARGREPIGARLDLHGLTQVEAHAALLRFLRRAQADGDRIALVVTGKGADKGGEVGQDLGARNGATERGVLRRQVPMWLSLPEFRPLVVGFEDAHASHGGQGALYVQLRRAR